MGVVCNACGTEYAFDLTAVAKSRRSLRFRCTSCGHRFTLSPERVAALVESQATAAEPQTPGLLLRHGARVYHVKDQATLQRWIVERRIQRSDQISMGDGEWLRADTQPELAAFFALVDEADGREVVVPGVTDVGFEAPSDQPPIAASAENVVDTWTTQELERPILPAPLALSREPTPTPLPAEPADSDLIEPSPLPISASGGPGSSPSMNEPAWLDRDPELTPIEQPLPLANEKSSVDLTAVDEAFFDMDADLEELPIDDDWEPPPPRRDPIPWLIGGVTAVVVTIAMFMFNDSQPEPAETAALTQASTPAVDLSTAEEIAPPSNAPVLVAAAAPPPEDALTVADAAPVVGNGADPEPAAEEPAAEEPAPDAALAAVEAPPQPAPKPRPKVRSTKSLISSGWGAVSRGDLAEAQNLFGLALDRNPTSAEARYGLGYAYEKMGNPETAYYQYCQALREGAQVSTRREIEGRLGKLGRECSN
ncbi:MAG: tetratricopeptide repeat protein [Myxococcota bacterium]